MTEERVDSITVGVTTTDGDRTSHTYFPPNDGVVERLEYVESLARLIWSALRAQNDVRIFHNPVVLYRTDHITSVEVTSDELIEELYKLSNEAI